ARHARSGARPRAAPGCTDTADPTRARKGKERHRGPVRVCPGLAVLSGDAARSVRGGRRLAAHRRVPAAHSRRHRRRRPARRLQVASAGAPHHRSADPGSVDAAAGGVRPDPHGTHSLMWRASPYLEGAAPSAPCSSEVRYACRARRRRSGALLGTVALFVVLLPTLAAGLGPVVVQDTLPNGAALLASE